MQPPCIQDLHTALLRLPATKRAVGDAMLADGILRWHACLMLRQNADNLFLGVALALHRETSRWLSLWEKSLFFWLPFWGKDHTPHYGSIHCYH